jgi:hypothetical protein
MDRVDQRAPQARSGIGQGVDGVHDSGVRGYVEGIEPIAHLVRDVDLPFAVRHSWSVPIAILTPQHVIAGRLRRWRFGWSKVSPYAGSAPVAPSCPITGRPPIWVIVRPTCQARRLCTARCCPDLARRWPWSTRTTGGPIVMPHIRRAAVGRASAPRSSTRCRPTGTDAMAIMPLVVSSSSSWPGSQPSARSKARSWTRPERSTRAVPTRNVASPGEAKLGGCTASARDRR